MDCAKWLPLMTMIGAVNQIRNHSEVLLRSIGAWDKFGVSGWGDSGTSSIFSEVGSSSFHYTGASNHFDQYYENPSLVERVRQLHAIYFSLLPSYIFNYFPSFSENYWDKCLPTTHVEIIPSPSWQLRTFHCNALNGCVKKTVGGDEFQIIVQHTQHIIWAITNDLNDGDYSLNIQPDVSDPIKLHSPVFMLRLIYTCGRKMKDIPSIQTMKLL